MLQFIKDFLRPFVNLRRKQLLERWKLYGENWREGQIALLYRVWESGYISGRRNVEPKIAWGFIETILGVKRGISKALEEMKGGKDESGTKEKTG